MSLLIYGIELSAPVCSLHAPVAEWHRSGLLKCGISCLQQSAWCMLLNWVDGSLSEENDHIINSKFSWDVQAKSQNLILNTSNTICLVPLFFSVDCDAWNDAALCIPPFLMPGWCFSQLQVQGRLLAICSWTVLLFYCYCITVITTAPQGDAIQKGA